MLTAPEEYKIRMMVEAPELIRILLNDLRGKIRLLAFFNNEPCRYYVINKCRESAVIYFIIINTPSELS